jgi:conjugative relaxase-like TrwC/TraI family protein
MLKITSLNSNGKTATGAGMLKYLQETEYYKDAKGNEVSASRWLGKGAKDLQLYGSVKNETMDKLAQGVAPDGTPLCKNAGADHRVGYDLTFSADKSVSVLLAAATGKDREAVIEAHHRAVNQAMSYIESQATTRRGTGGEVEIKVDGLVASGFTHFASRNLDCQLHEHVLVYNVAKGEDGKWGTFNNDILYELQMSAGAIYRAELAHQLQSLGYGVEKQTDVDADGRETGQVYFGVAGIEQKTLDAFSSRRAEIEAYMEKHQVSAQLATLATRKNKSEPSFDELTQIWSQTLDEMRKTDNNLFLNTKSLKGKSDRLERLSDSAILNKLHRMESTFTRAQLVERLALENVGRLSGSEIVEEADRFIKRTSLIELEKNEKGQERFTSQRMLDLEQSITTRSLARKDDVSVRVSPELVAIAILEFEQEKSAKLSTEQRQAVEWITQGTGGTACVSGFAGTGKTFSALAFKKAFEADGRQLIGVAIAWDAAKKLEAETGMTSYSTASILHKLEEGKLILNSKNVIVLDEAGMAGTETIAKLQSFVDKAGAKLILQGDALQLQPIEAGGAFRLAIKAAGETKLSNIRRQGDIEDRITSSLFYGLDEATIRRIDELDRNLKTAVGIERQDIERELYVLESKRMESAKSDSNSIDGEAILNRLEKRGQVSEADTRQDAIKQLVKDYFLNSETPREKLVLAGTRAEVNMLAGAIRQGFKERGLLGINEYEVKSKSGGVIKNLMLSSGDRIRFTEKNKQLDVFNGTSGVIENIHLSANGGYDVSVRLESEIKSQEGRVVKFNTNEFKSLDYNYSSTVHKSQGQGRSSVMVLANSKMTNLHFALVAFTRTKKSFALYAQKDELKQLSKRMGKSNLKINASELERKKQVEQQSKSFLKQIVNVGAKIIDFTKARLQRPQNPTPPPVLQVKTKSSGRGR